MTWIGIAPYYLPLSVNHRARTVAHGAFSSGAVDLHDLGIVHFAVERRINGGQIRMMAVRRELNALQESAAQILHEPASRVGVASADEPRRDQLRVGVDGRPRPHVAPSMRLLFLGDVLLFRANELPDFIALETARAEHPHIRIMESRACHTEFSEQFENRGLAHVRHARRAPDAVALNQGGYYGGSLCGGQLIHGVSQSIIEVENLTRLRASPLPESATTFKAGDWVQWESQGVLQFETPKRLLSLSQDGGFAFVEGTQTGIPIDQLRKAEPPPAPEVGAKLPLGTVREVSALDEGEALLQWPASLSAASVEELEAWLQLVIKKLKRRASAKAD